MDQPLACITSHRGLPPTRRARGRPVPPTGSQPPRTGPSAWGCGALVGVQTNITASTPWPDGLPTFRRVRGPRGRPEQTEGRRRTTPFENFKGGPWTSQGPAVRTCCPVKGFSAWTDARPGVPTTPIKRTSPADRLVMVDSWEAERPFLWSAALAKARLCPEHVSTSFKTRPVPSDCTFQFRKGRRFMLVPVFP